MSEEDCTVIRIEKWVLRPLAARMSGTCVAPEAPEVCVAGNVYGHPAIADGDWGVSTRIVGAGEGCLRTKSGREYHLGEPDEEYERENPNARERTLKARSGS